MNFRVNVQELRSAGDTFENLRATGSTLQQHMSAVSLVQSDFGRVPWLQTRVWESFSEHTSSCRDALVELTDMLGTIHDGLHFSADSYQELEEAAEHGLVEFFDGMGR